MTALAALTNLLDDGWRVYFAPNVAGKSGVHCDLRRRNGDLVVAFGADSVEEGIYEAVRAAKAHGPA